MENEYIQAFNISNEDLIYHDPLDIEIYYSGARIALVMGFLNNDGNNAIGCIDILISDLQKYNNELKSYYGIDSCLKKGLIKSEQTHVYVMYDDNNGLYKIGRSINPSLREKTLGGSLPSLEMIFVSPITHRKNEKVLHCHFKEKRVRGEWFSLNESDFEHIKNFNYGSD